MAKRSRTPIPIGGRSRRERAGPASDVDPERDGEGEAVSVPKAPFVECEAAREIGARLISDYHRHLQEARILYLFSGKKMTRNGRVVLGKAMRMGDLHRFLSALNSPTPPESVTPDEGAADFAIVLNREPWDDELTEKQRIALVDHELMHCVKSPKGKWSLRNHDWEGFTAEIDRHGLWFEDIQVLAQSVIAAHQLTLALDREPVGAPG